MRSGSSSFGRRRKSVAEPYRQRYGSVMQWSTPGFIGICAVIAVIAVMAVLMNAYDGHVNRRDLKRSKGGPPPKPAPEIDPTKW